MAVQRANGGPITEGAAKSASFVHTTFSFRQLWPRSAVEVKSNKTPKLHNYASPFGNHAHIPCNISHFPNALSDQSPAFDEMAVCRKATGSPQ
jgi:hypothetical protein